jgi:hypothetical protein
MLAVNVDAAFHLPHRLARQPTTLGLVRSLAAFTPQESADPSVAVVAMLERAKR